MAKALITGTSRGLGRSLANELTKRRYSVVATARKLEDINDLRVFQKLSLDVTDGRQVAEVRKECGAVDVLINNAAYSVAGPVEALPVDEVRKEYETNVLGPLRLIQAFLPGMREAGRGTIVNISSVAGRFAPPYGGSYASAKAALAMISEALRFEVQHFGIRVILIEAGAIRTDFALNQKKFTSPVYRDLDAQMDARFENYLKQDNRNPPDDIARMIADAVEKPGTGLRVTAGNDAAYMISLHSRSDEAEWVRSPIFSGLKW